MLANFFTLFRPRRHSRDPFVTRVEERAPRPRSRRVELVLGAGWVAVAAKAGWIVWAAQTHGLPFHPAWLIAPTVLFAVLATGVYWASVRR